MEHQHPDWVSWQLRPSPEFDAAQIIDPRWTAWVKSRPLHIQYAIAQYPPMSMLLAKQRNGETVTWYLIGWNETQGSDEVMLIFSDVDPMVDYDVAHSADHRHYVCAHHFDDVEQLL